MYLRRSRRLAHKLVATTERAGRGVVILLFYIQNELYYSVTFSLGCILHCYYYCRSNCACWQNDNILSVVYYEDVCYWCCCFKYLLNIARLVNIAGYHYVLPCNHHIVIFH